MNVFRANGHTPIIYDQQATRKEASKKSHENLITEKNQMKQLFAEASAYDEINYDSYSQKYFKELNMSMANGVSGYLDRYEELYNEITNSTPEGKTRDSLYQMLDQAFDNSTSFYADSMATSIWALSGVKLKAEIPALGTHTMKKHDTQAFDNVNQSRKQMINEFKNMFSAIKSYFNNNGGFSEINKNTPIGGSNSLTINDLDTLRGGMMKELIDLDKSGASSEKVSERINTSELSDSAKQLLNGIVQSDYDNKK